MGQPATIYLASQSPRRKQLLSQLGINAHVLALPGKSDSESALALGANSDLDHVDHVDLVDHEALEAAKPHEDPKDYVQRVTLLKLARGLGTVLQSADLAAVFTKQQALVLAADTTVALGGQILGKPQNAADAVRMLKLLSGQTHQVHTAVAVQGHSLAPKKVLVSSHVTFAQLSNDWIGNYVASGEPMDKAGAYGIQGAAGAMIPRIDGSFAAIMGLPLYETLNLIKSVSIQLKQ